MPLATLQVRRLELSPGAKAGVSIGSIVAALVVAAFGFWAYRRHLANQAAKREVYLEKVEEIQQESTDEDEDDIEASVESKSSEDTHDKSISMCRSGTMNSLDVHSCASGFCDICRKDKEPSFLGVKKLAPGTEGRIRSLPAKWWERDQPFDKLETITSESCSGDWGEELQMMHVALADSRSFEGSHV